MATLSDQHTGQRHKLRGRALIGRSRRADVQLRCLGASAEHALITWDGEEWSLRDLKSRNGTWINGTALTGRTWRLVPGDRITFGDPEERWVWLDGVPPRASAVRTDGSVVEAAEQLLALPAPDDPKALVYHSEAGWLLEADGETHEVADQQWVQVDGEGYRLELPEYDAQNSRTRTVSSTRDLRAAAASFWVSLDEEHVELTVEAPDGKRRLPPHSYHYMLLVLARARLADVAAGVDDAEAGWVYVDELTRQLATDPMRLNVDICRARKLVDELGWFSNPEELVQRRRPAKQVRIGFANLEVLRAQAVGPAR